ncbi:hypothetical protein D9613_002222 [Agrocybe pediades]|uniref:Uncharacterized protein n=1 Tax=Agrocybe pediades TaxID=84607 RepID=A0A8H4R5Y8_9AGAR|nr:hypothetical protein D9613_002222 [Agrocybe pediades]
MSDYDFRPGGSLKLKGGVAEGGIVKKKKKKSKHVSESVTKHIDSNEVGKDNISGLVDNEKLGSGSSRNSPALAGGSTRKTEAERRFEEVQKRRLEQRIKKLAHKTHKDRVNEFNAHLESLSEHHDIPKASLRNMGYFSNLTRLVLCRSGQDNIFPFVPLGLHRMLLHYPIFQALLPKATVMQ